MRVHRRGRWVVLAWVHHDDQRRWHHHAVEGGVEGVLPRDRWRKGEVIGAILVVAQGTTHGEDAAAAIERRQHALVRIRSKARVVHLRVSKRVATLYPNKRREARSDCSHRLRQQRHLRAGRARGWHKEIDFALAKRVVGPVARDVIGGTARVRSFDVQAVLASRGWRKADVDVPAREESRGNWNRGRKRRLDPGRPLVGDHNDATSVARLYEKRHGRTGSTEHKRSRRRFDGRAVSEEDAAQARSRNRGSGVNPENCRLVRAVWNLFARQHERCLQQIIVAVHRRNKLQAMDGTVDLRHKLRHRSHGRVVWSRRPAQLAEHHDKRSRRSVDEV
mmetsp:Transcript_7045/g.23363  ORF Transcript_7045/g.23363 Transcript_7045/m.23363 type:complete len:334 (-) Transcript_7045:315-1316(-)